MTAPAGRKSLAEQLKASPHRLVHETYHNNNWELFTRNADGSDERNLTNTPGVNELYPQVSPDGERICFLVDTGMGRLGVPVNQATKLIKAITRLPNVNTVGLYTHYAFAESNQILSRAQRTHFHRLIGGLKTSGHSFPHIHMNNSAGLLHEPKSTHNLARPGLLVYGVLPAGTRRPPAILKRNIHPALSWKCRVSLIKDITKGTKLSYGQTFTAPRRMRVATLTAGYGDGYLHSGSGRARVLIGGRACPILGRITMDQMLADVSRVKNVKPGDEAVLIGRQGKQKITPNQLAKWADTIPCEILTAITYRVPRVYRGGQAA